MKKKIPNIELAIWVSKYTYYSNDDMVNVL